VLNPGQTLLSGGGLPLEIRITDGDRGGMDAWLVCATNAGMQLTTWYTTNLLDTNGWVELPGVTQASGSGVSTQSFLLPTNSPVYYFRMHGRGR